jgi:hypothetical protein
MSAEDLESQLPELGPAKWLVLLGQELLLRMGYASTAMLLGLHQSANL